MSSKNKIVSILIIAANVLLCTSVYANSDTNWDYPTSRIVEAKKIENKLFMTTSTVQWSADQLKLFQSNNASKQFFPALSYKVTGSDELRSKLMLTNAPGAKFTRKLATYAEGEEIKLSIQNTTHLVADKPYVFYTAWLHTADSDSQVSLRSMQRYSQPNGTLNDLSKTDDEIARITFDKAEPINKKYREIYLPESFDSPFKQYTAEEEAAADVNKVKSYALIDSKEKLESYKRENAQRLKFASDQSKVQFAVTFKNNGFTRPDLLAKEYNLNLSQIYASGIKENGEEYTVSWYDTGMEVISLMNLKESGFKKFEVTELEGTAYVGDLQKMSQISNVDVIEIQGENERQVPTGVHWLNVRYGN
ncbi:hypothetical protein [Paenibacillus sp. P36]|uniref:hypothetical protein n=1 Tax=Paenibacillus sp. P36 TaxID=3342538 RepID=UPI0038B2DD81